MCLENGSQLLSAGTGRPADDGRIVSIADHHLHIQSPIASEELRSVHRRLPEIFTQLNPALLAPRTGEDAIRVLDDAGIRQGVLLSEAYIFTSPFATPGLEGAEGLTRQENQFNVDAALASGGRLKAFIGVNPFSAFALDELNYWAGRPGVSGIKLHLGNSGFNPRSAGDLATLGRFVASASAAGLPLLIHVRHPGPYHSSDTDRFIESVLSQANGITVQVAHGGGGGGAGEAAEVLEHYADSLERQAPGLAHLIIDLSCVLVLDPTTAANAALLERVAQSARRIGVGRFVMGSDWPTLCSPREHDALITSQLPFTPAEWAIIANNRAPYLV